MDKANDLLGDALAEYGSIKSVCLEKLLLQIEYGERTAFARYLIAMTEKSLRVRATYKNVTDLALSDSPGGDMGNILCHCREQKRYHISGDVISFHCDGFRVDSINVV